MITGEAIVRDDLLTDLDNYEVVKRAEVYSHIVMYDNCTDQLIARLADMSDGYLIWHMVNGKQVYYQPGGGGGLRYEVTK